MKTVSTILTPVFSLLSLTVALAEGTTRDLELTKHAVRYTVSDRYKKDADLFAEITEIKRCAPTEGHPDIDILLANPPELSDPTREPYSGEKDFSHEFIGRNILLEGCKDMIGGINFIVRNLRIYCANYGDELARRFNGEKITMGNGQIRTLACSTDKFPAIALNTMEVKMLHGDKNGDKILASALLHEMIHLLGYAHEDGTPVDIPNAAETCCFGVSKRDPWSNEPFAGNREELIL